MVDNPLRVAALVDLPRGPSAGGHVKCWERLAAAAAQATSLPLDLTVYFSGRAETEELGPRTRLCQLPPVFSTARLKFLPYVPDHTDLAPYHPKLARELPRYDVIHTTDGFFAYARTAARVSRARNIPLVTSFHTDTPSYARIFTRQTIEKLFGEKIFGGFLARKMIEDWRWPERQEAAMTEKLRRHLRQCRYALVSRPEDQALAESVLGRDRVYHMRRGIDKKMFGSFRRDRAGIEADYNIPKGRIVALFVGRVDVGKNIHTLIAAAEKILAENYPLHLVVAGTGPAEDEVRRRLGTHASVLGFVKPEELARLYASVDVLAVPSEVEIHSMVAVEGIASGCPVLIAGKSGVAQLFRETPAIRIIESGVDAWHDALREFLGDVRRQAALRGDAADYSLHYLSGWQDVLADDLFAVWQRAAGRAVTARKAA